MFAFGFWNFVMINFVCVTLELLINVLNFYCVKTIQSESVSGRKEPSVMVVDKNQLHIDYCSVKNKNKLERWKLPTFWHI